MARRGTLKIIWEDKINDAMSEYHFSTSEDERKFRVYLESMYPLVEMVSWAILAVTLGTNKF